MSFNIDDKIRDNCGYTSLVIAYIIYLVHSIKGTPLSEWMHSWWYIIFNILLLITFLVFIGYLITIGTKSLKKHPLTLIIAIFLIGYFVTLMINLFLTD